jgi:hypothetical protein
MLTDTLFGYLVLSAKQAVPTLPPLERLPFKYTTQHIEGAYYGTVVNGTSVADPSVFYYPQRARNLRIFSALGSFYQYNKQAELAQAYADLETQVFDPDWTFQQKLEQVVQPKIVGNHFVVADSFGAQAFVSLMSRNVQVGFYGVYSDSFNLLAWTNIDSYATLARAFTNENLWVIPLEKRQDFTLVLHAQRLCSRWNRWRNPPDSAPFKPLDVGQRFAALERALFS